MTASEKKQILKGVFHVLVKENEGSNMFSEEQDFFKFISLIKRKAKQCQTKIYSYCLMNNLIHIVLKKNSWDVEKLINSICSSYSLYFNKKYCANINISENNIKSEPIENERYLLAAIRFVHNIPIKAGLVSNARFYKWSSFNEYIDKGTIVKPEDILKFIHDDMEVAKEKFIKFSQNVSDDYIMNLDMQKIIKERNRMIRELFNIHKLSTRGIAQWMGVSEIAVIRAINEKDEKK